MGRIIDSKIKRNQCDSNYLQVCLCMYVCVCVHFSLDCKLKNIDYVFFILVIPRLDTYWMVCECLLNE